MTVIDLDIDSNKLILFILKGFECDIDENI